MVLEVSPQEVQVDGRAHLEQRDQVEQRPGVLGVLLAILQQNLTQQHQLIPVIPLLLGLPPLLELLVLVLHHRVDLLSDPIRQTEHALHPAIGPFRQGVHDVQENVVVFLLGLGVLVEGLFDVPGFPGEFLSQREGLVELDQLQEALEVEFALLAVDEDRLARQLLTHGVEHLGQSLLDVHGDRVLAEFGREELRYVRDELEHDDDRVDGVVL